MCEQRAVRAARWELLTLSQSASAARVVASLLSLDQKEAFTMRPRRLLMPARFLVGKFIDRDAQSAAYCGLVEPGSSCRARGEHRLVHQLAREW